MMSQIHRLIKPFLLVTLSFLLVITACHNPIAQQSSTSTVQSGTASKCRLFKHRLGEACIPIEPKRIVALDVPAILDALLALGIKPVGTAADHFGTGEDWSGKRYFPALRPELVAGIELVGREGTPSIEKILMLKPDLVLLADQSEQSYAQLSKIAPAMLIDVWRDETPIKDNFRAIAQLLGKEKEAEEVLNQYQKRVTEFRRRLGDRLTGLEISVLAQYGNQFWLSPSFSSFFQVFQDLGLPIKPIFLEQKQYSTISLEMIDKLDGDILFLIQDINSSGSFLSEDALIPSLRAVRNKRAYVVNRKVWDFYGLIGMNLFLDDLEKYLL